MNFLTNTISVFWILPAMSFGAIIGVFIVSLCVAAKRNDEEYDREYERRGKIKYDNGLL